MLVEFLSLIMENRFSDATTLEVTAGIFANMFDYPQRSNLMTAVLRVTEINHAGESRGTSARYEVKNSSVLDLLAVSIFIASRLR